MEYTEFLDEMSANYQEYRNKVITAYVFLTRTIFELLRISDSIKLADSKPCFIGTPVNMLIRQHFQQVENHTIECDCLVCRDYVSSGVVYFDYDSRWEA